MDYKTGNYEEKLGFRQIVLEHLRKILDLNLKMVGQEYLIAWTHAYSTAINSLSDVLLPFFDKEMKAAEKKYDEKMKKTNKYTDGSYIKDRGGYSNAHRDAHRYLFQNLNLLLKRNDYLQSSIYGEDDKNQTADEEGEK